MGEDYKKKKALPPKLQVEFFDNPPTIGEIHHNQIFKFVENFKKFSTTNNKVSKNYLTLDNVFVQKLQLGIK